VARELLPVNGSPAKAGCARALSTRVTRRSASRTWSARTPFRAWRPACDPCAPSMSQIPPHRCTACDRGLARHGIFPVGSFAATFSDCRLGPLSLRSRATSTRP